MNEVQTETEALQNEVGKASKQSEQQTAELQSLEADILQLAEKLRVPKEQLNLPDTDQAESENAYVRKADIPYLTPKDFKHLNEMSKDDWIAASLIGVCAVLMDFMLVRTPRSISFTAINGTIVQKDGSALTDALCKIGFDADGKTSAWVKQLERYFKVSYDKSIILGEKGFGPKTHRVYSLAHDPSPSGLIWGIADSFRGGTSYIDGRSIVKFEYTYKLSNPQLLFLPMIWFGHILSDIFTKSGVPIPNSCLLRMIRCGSIGEKDKTIAQIVEGMYSEGYDLRHLLTMSICNVCIELLLYFYDILMHDQPELLMRPSAMRQIDEAMRRKRLAKMRVAAYAVASAGNAVKVVAYGFNPLAFNLPVWAGLLRNVLKECLSINSSDNLVMEIVNHRQDIDKQLDLLEAQLKYLQQAPQDN